MIKILSILAAAGFLGHNSTYAASLSVQIMDNMAEIEDAKNACEFLESEAGIITDKNAQDNIERLEEERDIHKKTIEISLTGIANILANLSLIQTKQLTEHSDELMKYFQNGVQLINDLKDASTENERVSKEIIYFEGLIQDRKQLREIEEKGRLLKQQQDELEKLKTKTQHRGNAHIQVEVKSETSGFETKSNTFSTAKTHRQPEKQTRKKFT